MLLLSSCWLPLYISSPFVSRHCIVEDEPAAVVLVVVVVGQPVHQLTVAAPFVDRDPSQYSSTFICCYTLASFIFFTPCPYKEHRTYNFYLYTKDLK